MAGLICDRLLDDDLESTVGATVYEAGDARWYDRTPNSLDATTEGQGPTESRSKRGRINVDSSPIGFRDSTDLGRRTLERRRPSDHADGRTVDLRSLLDRRPERLEAMRYGTIVHELLAGLEDLDDLANERPRRNPAMRVAGDRLRVERAWASLRSDEQRRFLRRVFDLKPSTALPGDRLEVWKERRFVLLDDQHRRLDGSFDRVIVTRRATGEAVGALVIDYKTDSVRESDSGASEADSDFIDRPTATEIEHVDYSITAERATAVRRIAAGYVDQMRSYREACSTMLGLPIDAIELKLAFLSERAIVKILND
jgi:hypothetical protein